MSLRAYRMVGPHPQATHFVCDAEAELPVTDCFEGDTAYAIDTGLLFRLRRTTWIESGPIGHRHAIDDTVGLTAGVAARPPFQILHKTADERRSLTTLADCSGLVFRAEANASYGFLLMAVFQTAATTVGPKFSMNGPSGGLLTSWRSEIEITGGPSTSAVNVRSVTVPDTEHVVSSVDQANTSRVARLQGSWRNGPTAGSVALRFGSEVAGTNITVKQGSWGLVFPLL